MADNPFTYTFGIHKNLRPVDLFVYVALDERPGNLA
jgi:hypothetical protein